MLVYPSLDYELNTQVRIHREANDCWPLRFGNKAGLFFGGGPLIGSVKTLPLTMIKISSLRPKLVEKTHTNHSG